MVALYHCTLKESPEALYVGGWSQTYGYDRWGNLWPNSGAAMRWRCLAPVRRASVRPGNQQDRSEPDTPLALSYDVAGNLTSYTSDIITYDVESRLVSMQDASIQGTVTYQYGG